MRQPDRRKYLLRLVHIYELHEQGHTHEYIAEKVGLDRSTVTYHLNKTRPKVITLPSRINRMAA